MNVDSEAYETQKSFLSVSLKAVREVSRLKEKRGY